MNNQILFTFVLKHNIPTPHGKKKEKKDILKLPIMNILQTTHILQILL